jgi:hypothetical protein
MCPVAIERDARKIKVEARMSWAELLDAVEAASGWLALSPELAADAARLEAIAGYLKRRAKPPEAPGTPQQGALPGPDSSVR